MVRGQELGARLERLQSELEQAALERQEFLREREFQHQRWVCCPRGREGQARACGKVDAKAPPGRYQNLEQLLEAELQAAATSKEEALMELKTRARQLEEELLQVRLLGPCPLPSVHPACRAPGLHELWSLQCLLQSCPSILGQVLILCPLLGSVKGALC